MLTITIVIIVITCLVSLAGFNNWKVHDDLMFQPGAMSRPNQYYRFFSYGFVHADYGHLFFNMFSLYVFGTRGGGLEKDFVDIFGANGKLLYIALYLLALLFSVLPDYFKHRNNYAYRALGASGAVCAVVFAEIVIDPMRGMGLILLPKIPGWIFGLLFVAISVYLARRGRDNIGHNAHISGAVFGLIFMMVVGRLYGYDMVQHFLSQIRIGF